MTLTATALLLLNVQRHDLNGHPHGHSDLIVRLQRNGLPDSPGETFGKGWTPHPDFRAEARDLFVWARRPDAFHGSDLGAQRHGRAVRDVVLLGFPEAAEAATMAASAQGAGFGATVRAQVSA